MVISPPEGMASQAFTMRLVTTLPISPELPTTIRSSGNSSLMEIVVPRRCASSRHRGRSVWMTSSTSSRRLKTCRSRSVRACEKRWIRRTVSAPRLAAAATELNSRFLSESVSSSSISSVGPSIPASVLFRSWATPPAIWPRARRRSAATACCSSALCCVTSMPTAMTPVTSRSGDS